MLLNSSKVIFSEKLFFVGKKLFFVVKCNFYQLNNVKVKWNKSDFFKKIDWMYPDKFSWGLWGFVRYIVCIHKPDF